MLDPVRSPAGDACAGPAAPAFGSPSGVRALRTGKDEGCNGGIMENAYEWIIKNGGITTEELYPYSSGTGVTGVCQMKKTTVKKAHISDYCDLIHDDEKDLEKALVQQVHAARVAVAERRRRHAHAVRSRRLTRGAGWVTAGGRGDRGRSDFVPVLPRRCPLGEEVRRQA